MNALAQALALYESSERRFEDDLAAFIHTGRVYITPTAVLFAKAVPSHIKQHDPWDMWEEAECDTWFVWLAAGDIREFFRYAPHPLKWVAFARKGRIKWHGYDKLLAKVCPSTASSHLPLSALTAASPA